MTNPKIGFADAARYAAEAAIKAAWFAAKRLETEARPEGNAEVWHIIDQAYWLCRAAQAMASSAADCLDPTDTSLDDRIDCIYDNAKYSGIHAGEAADDLVTLAEEAGHEIRR